MVNGDEQLVEGERQLHDATSSFVVEPLEKRPDQMADEQELSFRFDDRFHLKRSVYDDS